MEDTNKMTQKYMFDDKYITGEGGSSSPPAPRASVEAPNTLASSSSALVVEAISEGEIVGLIDGAKSIYLDGMPVQNSDGTYNFAGFSYEERVGLPAQDYLRGYPDIEDTVPVGVNVTKATPIQRTTSHTNVDAVRVNIAFSGIYQQVKSNGDVVGCSIDIAIDTRVVGGVWNEVFTNTITGKTMSIYDESYRIERPDPSGTGLWEIRVRRLTNDDVDSSIHTTFSWAFFVQVQDKKLPYNNTAVIGLKVDAKSTGGNVPRRSYKVKGIKCQVPVNYDPLTRIYTGIWNGTFKTAWTDNPAWVIYDLLTNTRYGLGTFLSATQVDKYSFYDVARYNDEMVPDGFGGTEPRFTYNNVINTRQEAWKLLQAVASNCRSVIYYGAGLIKIIQDRPTPTSIIVNRTDVLEGQFEYISTSMMTRHPVIQVTYNNKLDHYQPATVIVEDEPSIARYGYNVKEMVAYGAVTEGEARRLGTWALYTEMNTMECVKFTCGLNMATRMIPGEVIKIVDEDRMGVPYGGRIINGNTSSITLDREVTLLAGETYTIEWIAADGVTIESRQVINTPGTYSILGTNTPINAPTVGNSWILTSTNVDGSLFRIYTVTESGSTAFEVVAFQYIPEKYAAVDQVENPAQWTPMSKVLTYCPPPSVVTWMRETATDADGRKVINLRINWDQEDAQYISNYLVSYRRDNRDMSSTIVTSQREFIIPNAVAGEYEIFIYAQNISNIRSAVKISNYYNDLSGGVSGLSPVTTLTVKGGGTTWAGKDLTFTWAQNTNNQNIGDSVFKTYHIEIKDAVTNVVKRTYDTLSTEYTYYYDDNTVDFGTSTPHRDIKVTVYNKDSYNRLSNGVTATFTNPVPSAPTFTVTGGFQAYTVNITPPAIGEDVAGYYITEIATVGATPVIGNVVASGSGTSHSVPHYTASAIIKVGAYDLFDKTFSTVVFGAAQSVTVTLPADVIDTTEGYKFFSLTFKQNDPSANYISWTSSQVVRTLDGAVQTLPAGNAHWTGTALYLYYDWTTNAITSTTTLASALGVGKALVGTYYGGTTFHTGNGDAYIDGGKLLAQTVGANQLVADSAIITNNAQIGSAVIGGVNIANGAVTATKIASGTITANEIAANTITGNKLVTNSAIITDNAQIGNAVIGGVNIQDGVVTGTKIAANTITASNLITTQSLITTAAQIQDAVISTAKIGDLQVTSLKIGNNAVTATAYYDYQTVITGGETNGAYVALDTITFTGTGNKFIINSNINHFIRDGFSPGSTPWGPPTKDYYFNTRSFLKLEITHGSAPIVYDLTEFLEIGQAAGTMLQVATINSGTRWMMGDSFYGGQYKGQYLPYRTYQNPDSNGTTTTYSTLFPTVNGVVYTLKWYIRLDVACHSLDNTTTYNPVGDYTINKRLYAITEIKK